MTPLLSAVFLASVLCPPAQEPNAPLLERVEHYDAENGDVKIHYVRLGEGRPLVLLHGFPDWWYGWRDQIESWSRSHTVLAVDLRGYNRSDQPEGVASYAMPLLIGDVAAVIEHAGFESATVIGHDWGAAIAWQFAMWRPDLTERLGILSVPHPAGFGRELATNTEQHENSAYARRFQEEGAHESLSAAGLAGWVRDDDARALYVAAFERSSIEAMLNYYKANFPRTATPPAAGASAPAGAAPAPAPPPIPFRPVKCPVLVVHGLQDTALHADGHSGTWDHVEAEMTLHMLPEAGHWLQQDAGPTVTRVVADWLARTADSGL